MIMHIDRKLEKYLAGQIDFDEFYLVAAEPVNEKNAVMFLAPKTIGMYKYFCVRYGTLGTNWFGSIEEATKFALEHGYISKLKAKTINTRYYSVYRGEQN